MAADNYLSFADIGLDFLCSRCLINVDARTAVRALRTAADGTITTEFCPSPNNPRALRLWAGNRVAEGCRLQTDAADWTFEPVGTWHGDPVCETHLWECVDRERRGGRGA